MAYVSWGKCRVLVKNIDSDTQKWEEMPTPAEDSTELSTEDGDKLEAPVEGGQNEDVKYKDATYELKYDIRNTKGKAIPIEHVNGVVDGHYAIVVVPEDESCVACYIPKSSVSANTSYTAADGIKTTFTHSSLKPDSGQQLRLGQATVSGSGDSISISFAEIQKDGSYSSTAETL